MTVTAEEWLNDLETLADEAISSPTHHIARAYYAKSEAAQPETVKRLVGMVRVLAKGCDCDAESCFSGCTPACRLQMAYQQTESKA